MKTFHRIPVNDSDIHECSIHCKCNPHYGVFNLVIHNSFDKRENEEDYFSLKSVTYEELKKRYNLILSDDINFNLVSHI